MDEESAVPQRLDDTRGTGHSLVAKKVGRTKAYISNILHERLPMTDKPLGHPSEITLGIPLSEKGRMTQTGTSKPTQARAKKSRKSTDS